MTKLPFIDEVSSLESTTHILSKSAKGKTSILAAIAAELVKQDNKRIYFLTDDKTKLVLKKMVSYITGEGLSDLDTKETTNLQNKITSFVANNSALTIKTLTNSVSFNDIVFDISSRIKNDNINILILDIPLTHKLGELINLIKANFNIQIFSSNFLSNRGSKLNLNNDNYVILNDDQKSINIITSSGFYISHSINICFSHLKFS